eukprot:gene30487-36848_t
MTLIVDAISIVKAVFAIVCVGIVYQWIDACKSVPGAVTVKGYPFVGSVLHFLPSKLSTSLAIYRKTYGEIYTMHFFFVRIWVVSNAAIAREVLMKRPKHFRRRWGYSTEVVGITKGLLNANGALWSRVRRATAPSFSNLNVSNLAVAIEKNVLSWIDHLRLLADKKEIVDMTEEAFLLTVQVISRAAFGLEPDHAIGQYFFSSLFLEDVKSLFVFRMVFVTRKLPVWLWRLSPWYHYEKSAVIATNRFSEHAQAILDYKRSPSAEKCHSMLDSLVQRTDGQDSHNTLTDEEIIHNIKIFYIAGAETTAVTLNWICFFLALHPEVQERVRAEAASQTTDSLIGLEGLGRLPYTRAVVKEAVRLRSSVALQAADLEEDVPSVTLSNGLTVRQGELVWIDIDGLMTDEEVFPRPQTFWPERWLPEHSDPVALSKMEEAFLAFGSGPRVCPGIHLVFTETQLAIAHLIRSFNLTLACDPNEIHRVITLTLPPNKMPLIFTPV